MLSVVTIILYVNGVLLILWSCITHEPDKLEYTRVGALLVILAVLPKFTGWVLC